MCAICTCSGVLSLALAAPAGLGGNPARANEDGVMRHSISCAAPLYRVHALSGSFSSSSTVASCGTVVRRYTTTAQGTAAYLAHLQCVLIQDPFG